MQNKPQNTCVLLHIISINLHITSEKSNRPHTEFHCVLFCSHSESVTAQAPHSQETLAYFCSV
jgi:hypothetical protein